MNNKNGNKLKKNSNDIIYTPKPIALKMIEMCEIKEGSTFLDPSKGGGIFYDNLPSICIKDYCEILENKDFFKYNKNVDLIIGNPPYSLWDRWIEHTMKLTNKFCYILGFLNFTDKRDRNILNNGFGITKIHLLKIDWWFSHSYIVIFEKGKESIITVEPKCILCDICNGRCKRGRAGNHANICTNNVDDLKIENLKIEN
jgi:hypothetical protein